MARITKAQIKEEARANACKILREKLPPGSTVHTILRHVSRSGMMRHISVVFNSEDITHLVARILDHPVTTGGFYALKVGGCGMDMGFAVVYNLSDALYPHGFRCIGRKKRCPASDHSNGINKRNHTDGGYALRQAWL